MKNEFPEDLQYALERIADYATQTTDSIERLTDNSTNETSIEDAITSPVRLRTGLIPKLVTAAALALAYLTTAGATGIGSFSSQPQTDEMV